MDYVKQLLGFERWRANPEYGGEVGVVEESFFLVGSPSLDHDDSISARVGQIGDRRFASVVWEVSLSIGGVVERKAQPLDVCSKYSDF